MTEAEFLAALRVLPLHPGAAGLRDDTASLGGYTLTTDTLVEGVHFLPDDPPGDVAWKLVATNLSDLAAKGALPEGVLLNYSLGSPAKAGGQSGGNGDEARRAVTSASPTGPRPSPGSSDAGSSGWDTAFLAGLAEALTTFAVPLLGGDTVSLPPGAARVLTLTAIGRDAAAPPRSGARGGDALWVTGTVGDAAAGLAIAKGKSGPPDLLAAYRRPWPRLAEGRSLAPLVHAMMDVSDGLLIDAARLAAASGLAVEIDLAKIPLSPSYRASCGDERAARLAAATAGDDYQLLFAAPAGWRPPVPATCIGAFAPGNGLTLRDNDDPVPLPDRLGFEH
jgi:thiamine-monophosphate kinase